MSTEKIGVGIIGAGGWARYGHIPALRIVDQFRDVAVSSRRRRRLTTSAGIWVSGTPSATTSGSSTPRRRPGRDPHTGP